MLRSIWSPSKCMKIGLTFTQEVFVFNSLVYFHYWASCYTFTLTPIHPSRPPPSFATCASLLQQALFFTTLSFTNFGPPFMYGSILKEPLLYTRFVTRGDIDWFSIYIKALQLNTQICTCIHLFAFASTCCFMKENKYKYFVLEVYFCL